MSQRNSLAPPSQNSLVTPRSLTQEEFLATVMPPLAMTMGLSSGIQRNVQGLKQSAVDPFGTAKQTLEGIASVVKDPWVVLQMLRAARQKAMSGPFGLGELIGENLTPGMRGRGRLVNRMAGPEDFMARLRELYGDFAQAYNIGLPDTPEFRRIVRDVTANGPLSDDALSEAVKAHPQYLQAGGKAKSTELRQTSRGGAARLVDSLTRQGIQTRVETSKSPGSRSTYVYASKGDKTVKIRLSDHLPAESGRVYGTNDIMTTPQHWKSAAKRAANMIGENVTPGFRNRRPTLQAVEALPQAQSLNWPQPDKIPRGATLQMMSPQDYLKKVNAAQGIDFESAPSPIRKPKTISNIKTALQKGETIETPWLTLHKGKIVDQEGRHRAVAAMQAGISEMPVFIYERK